MERKNRFIQDIVDAIREEFREDAFSIAPTNEANSLLLERAFEDEKVTFSILSTESCEKVYSIQVTCEGDKYRKRILRTADVALYVNFDIPIDRYADKDEIIAILKRYE